MLESSLEDGHDGVVQVASHVCSSFGETRRVRGRQLFFFDLPHLDLIM